jgi:hypothetical protein
MGPSMNGNHSEPERKKRNRFLTCRHAALSTKVELDLETECGSVEYRRGLGGIFDIQSLIDRNNNLLFAGPI